MMQTVQVTDFFVQNNYFIYLETIENKGSVKNNFFVQRNSKNYFVQRNFWNPQNQWFKKILELICIYKYIQNIFFYNISKNIIIGGIENDSR